MIDNKKITAEGIFNLALKNHQENKPEEAQDLYSQVLKIDPNHSNALNNLGVLFKQLKKSYEAVSCFEKLIKIDPTNLNVLNTLGNTYKELKEIQKAIECYEKAIEIDQNYVIARNNLGVLLEQLGEFQKAKACYEKVIEIDPKYVRAHSNLGIVLRDLGEYQKAKTCFEKAIEIDPKYVRAHNQLGITLTKLEDYKNAKVCYEKAIEINPDYIEAYNNLGIIFFESGKNQEAIECYEKAIEIDPKYAKGYLDLGVLFRKLGEKEKAKEYYKKAIEINPDYIKAYNNLGLLFKEFGDYPRSIDCFEKTIEIDPSNEDSYKYLGIIHEACGNQEKSVEYFQEALKKRSKIKLDDHKEEDQALRPATTDFFLELTNKCNFHCEFCPSDSQTRLHGFMELPLVKKIVDEISEKKIVTRINLHLMGEPTLHPKLNEILAYAKSKDVKVDLTTNGSTLVKKKVPMLLDNISGSIVASLMTPTKETYKTRGDVGLSWDRYVDNFRLLIQEHLKKILRGDKIHYEIVFRVMVSNNEEKGRVRVLESSKSVQENYEEWSNFTETVEKELGLKSFARETIDPKKIFSLLENEVREVGFYLQKNIKIQFWRAFTFANTRVDEEYKLEVQEKAQFCPHPFTDFGVLWNGDVSLCCLDYDATLKVGNVKTQSVEDVINGTASKKLRASMYGLEKLHPTCVKCQSQAVKK